MKTKQITVITGLVIKDNKILMTQRYEPECPDAHMKWEIPGGKVEYGETIEQSIVRELREETGVQVQIKQLLPMTFTAYWDYEWGSQQTLLLCFLCEYISEKEVPNDHHVKKVSWINVGEVEKLPMLQGAKEFIDYALTKNQFPV